MSYSLRYGIHADGHGVDHKNLTVKFVLVTHYQINFMISELERIIDIKQPCDIEFNFNKCPPAIRDDVDIKNKLRNILYPKPQHLQFLTPTPQPNLFPPAGFTAHASGAPAHAISVNDYIDMQKVNESRAARLIPTIHLHIREHGANPDLTVLHTEKGRKKIWNYIKSAGAVPNMTMDESLYIATRVQAMLEHAEHA
jgi:hypothetical protein